MKKMAVIAQTADPGRGSEFATGWSFIREFYLDPRILETHDVDVYISRNRNNKANIEKEIIDLELHPKFIFVPQVFPKAHYFAGRLLRILWQFKVCAMVRKVNYDLIHQVSPNSLIYLNPIFALRKPDIKILGPMRIEANAAIGPLYMRDKSVFVRHLAIHIKEIIENVFLKIPRQLVLKRTALHLSPIAGHTIHKNQIYCRESAFVDTSAQPTQQTYGSDWNVIWSGLGDPLRKNEHLAGKIIQSVLKEPLLDDVKFTIVGGSKKISSSHRVWHQEKLPRDAFLKILTPQTIYLCTSLLELNSVLAEEVLACGGRVVAGQLPGFLNRPDTKSILTVGKYDDVNEWVQKICSSIKSEKSSSVSVDNFRKNLSDRLIDAINSVQSIPPRK